MYNSRSPEGSGRRCARRRALVRAAAQGWLNRLRGSRVCRLREVRELDQEGLLRRRPHLFAWARLPVRVLASVCEKVAAALIIPWGNTHIEQVNSGAGLINTKLRWRMTPDTLQRMVLFRVCLRFAIARIEAAGMDLNMETMRAAIFCGGGGRGGGVRCRTWWSASFVR